ncbi:murein biosynthesis integral membrane protein MurJ [Rhodococcus opacus]|uniref:murein biosynthesis integral membrane protein MurJ n=1 Tax=Rhodococcus opacus TaxID=37919 RepID=UPI0009BCBB07|nr:murein biosynthesis integral membrane protein MurJ [Rhodococcus opacus]MDX5968177.1 murein biosynthesis integral membrane protein MurJ [Rhodococcus opacus]NKY73260.1 murein biosynthesis integral membrane protein MurJ [Rhodococcus opacus]QZS53045.1 murein biosynthesis integral membrane protein MurJ [Rhodococcus opacus]RKM73869.1 murein biosynthesis integral membrane protein MurJ [Rhodococcus opacus]
MTGNLPSRGQRLPDRSHPRVAPWERDHWAREIRPDEAPTVQFAAIRVDPSPPPVRDSGPSTAPQKQGNSRLLASTGSIAVATLVSRITGFAKQLLVLTLLGGSVASSFTVASQIPNMISELVLGAVLTAIVVPVLVRAEREDPDQGAAFVRRLFTATCVLLGTAALLATAAAPVLTTHVFLSADGKVNTSLTTALSYLLLPAILFYGLSALLTAILNTRQVFKPGAWAPVLNNVVMLTVLVIYYATPGEITLDPVRMSDPKLLVLGVGVTLGVVVQAMSLVPAIRREGISLKPLWGLDDRLKQFGGMAVAIILYVLISQAGMIVATRISSHADASGPAIYNNAWLLLQLPYGVLGVTVLTAIMPRLSRNAAADDTPAVVDDLSVATRLTMISLIPIITFLTFAGPEIGQALYGYGNFGTGDAERLGQAVSWSAFTLIPYSLVLIQLRVFYAREQAWTPTWIVLGITAVKIALSALTPMIASSDDQVVILLGVANGLGYITGALVGGWLLHRSLGNLQMANVGKTVWVVVLASMAGALVMLGADRLLGLDRLTSLFGGPGSMVRVMISGVLMLVVTFVILWFAKIPEIVSITVAVARKVRALRGRGAAQEPEADPLAEAETELIPVVRATPHDFGGQPRGIERPGGLPYPGHERVGSPPGTGRSWAFENEGVRVSDDDVAGSKRAGGSTVQASERDSAAAPNGVDAPTTRIPSESASTDAAKSDKQAGTDAPQKKDAATSSGSADTPKTGQSKETGDPADAQTKAAPKTPADDAGESPRDTRHMGAAPARDLSYDTGVIPITPAPGREPGAGPRRTPRGPKLIPGASVAGGRYRLLTPHGGSRGLQFWQALDVKLDREVALTFVDAEQRSTSAGPEGPQAILSRTLRLGRINSPGLARVLDVVRGSSGGIVVAEWTPGRSLREMADTKPSPIGAASAIRALAAAAETAHRAGGALSIDHPDRVRISINGDAVLAFPATLADSDSSSDVRGLGAMLYALITARWPLGDPSAPAGDPSGSHRPGTVGGMRLADRDSSGQPIGPRVIRPEVPFEISAVALRSLEPNGGIRTAATVQHILDQASVVNDKTEFIPVLRLGQRGPGTTGHALADPEALEAEKKKSNRMIAALVGLAVVTIIVLALLGFWLATFLTGSSSDAPLTEQDFGLTTSAEAPPNPESPAPAPAPAANVAPVSPSGATVFSPQGTPDSAANARLAVDGNTSTVWSTDSYFQPFPALKNGVGLMVTLDEPATLSSVWINSPTPGTNVEIRSAPSENPTLDQTQVLGSKVLGNGVTDIPVKSEGPTKNILVWITGLSNSGGKNQSSIADIGFNAAT